MVQGPLQANVATNGTSRVPLKVDPATGALVVKSDAGGDAVTLAAGAVAAGAYVAGSALDGWDATQGTKADAAWASGSGSLIAIMKAAAGPLLKLIFGAAGSLLTATGINGTTNLTAAAVVKNAAGRACKLIVLDPGTTGGAFVLNDSATTGAAATANEIYRIAFNAAANVAGTVINLDYPVTNGLVLSAVPTGGTPRVAVVWN